MKRCELLIPAGGKKQYIAAVENGADAVYVGGKAFNARMNAENFSDDELEKAIDYGHVRDVKTYITMNTLLTDEQLEPALRQAGLYCMMGADGVIVQDLGLGLLIKERLPELPLHLSTQAGVYDAEGVKAAAKLGYERVVLARELSFEEIKAAVATGVEIETFIHGALCMCYSGQCQLSRVIGGRSGNKGGCAQPCRLPYKGSGEPYPLSPKDLCLIEEIGMLAEAGVASLKVEGRMKSPEYVAVVTSIYRKYLDRAYETGNRENEGQIDEEDMLALKQIFNRGGFTKGYFYGDPGEKLMASQLSKNAGVFVGKIEKDGAGPLALVRPLSYKSGACRTDISPDTRTAEAAGVRNIMQISKGDYIEIRGKGISGNSGNLVTFAEKTGGGLLRVGDVKVKVHKGDRVYKLASGRLMEAARKTFEGVGFDGGGYLRKVPVNMKAAVEAGKPIELEISLRGAEKPAVKRRGIIAEKSTGGAGCADVLAKQLSKTGGTPFYAASVDASESGSCYVPVSAVNALRREALSELTDKIKNSHKRKITAGYDVLERDLRDNGRTRARDKAFEMVFYDAEEFMQFDLEAAVRKIRDTVGRGYKIRILVPVHGYERCAERETLELSGDGSIGERPAANGDDRFSARPEANGGDCFGKTPDRAEKPMLEIIPYIMPMNKGAGDLWIEENFEKLSRLLKEKNRPIYVGNIRWLERFAQAGVETLGDSGLNITNEWSRRAYRMLGMKDGALSLEEGLSGMGAFPLMIIEHKFAVKQLTDRKGQRYKLRQDDFSHKTVLLKKDAAVDWGKIRSASEERKDNIRIYIEGNNFSNRHRRFE